MWLFFINKNIFPFYIWKGLTICLWIGMYAKDDREDVKDTLNASMKATKQRLPLMISGTPLERLSSFKYLGANISEDLTWTTHIQTQVKKARQRLYHLRQLRKFRVSPAILKTFYSGAIESVLTLRICSPLSAGHLPQTLQKQSC